MGRIPVPLNSDVFIGLPLWEFRVLRSTYNRGPFLLGYYGRNATEMT